MPELPEVETIVRDLRNAGICGSRILSLRVGWSKTVATHSPVSLKKLLINRVIEDIHRRAKFIVLSLSGGLFVYIHLRMSGRISLSNHSGKNAKHDHIILKLSGDRSLHFNDARKFGRWYAVENPAIIENKLGPEPLSDTFKAADFTASLLRKNRQIKPLLLDQSFISGIGNIYADEALFDARIHPLRLSSSLSNKESRVLYRSIRKVLQRGVDNLGTSLGKSDTNYYSVGKRRGRNQDALKVFRRTGEPCPRCRHQIERLIIGQRSSHICPRCQL